MAQGDNATIINPKPKPEREKERRGRVDAALELIEMQATAARALPYKERIQALRGMLKTILLNIPHDLSAEKKAELAQAFLDSPWDSGDEFYDMPHVSIDGDLINIRGNYSIRQLARRLQW